MEFKSKKNIGIDPDVDKSGFAVWDKNAQKIVKHTSLKFWDLIDEIDKYNTNEIEIIIEGGWLIKKSNFHQKLGQGKEIGENIAKKVGQGKEIGENIAKKVGRNHQVGILIQEYCQNKNISHKIVKPQGKFSKKFVKSATAISESNEDIRDAIMLVAGK